MGRQVVRNRFAALRETPIAADGPCRTMSAAGGRHPPCPADRAGFDVGGPYVEFGWPRTAASVN